MSPHHALLRRRVASFALVIGVGVAGCGAPAKPAASVGTGADTHSPKGALESPTDAELATAQVGSIRIRYAERGTGPLVLLLHGFPESWYSWRHQLGALSAAGYRVVAPDMRGYGGTDAPDSVEEYDILDLCGDVTGLMDHLGEKRAILVGHDWGAAVTWMCALLAPERFDAVVALSVPWGPRGNRPPLAQMREVHGDNFFYMLYFQEPGVAEAELDPDPRGLLLRFFGGRDVPREPPTITSPKADAGGLLGRIGLPKELPAWLSQRDFDYFVSELERTGFRGGLNYYRNLDRSWELTPQLAGATIQVPVLFAAGEFDLTIAGQPRDGLERRMRAVAPALRAVHLLPGAGHWIQQERADDINALLLDFVRSIPGYGAQRD